MQPESAGVGLAALSSPITRVDLLVAAEQISRCGVSDLPQDARPMRWLIDAILKVISFGIGILVLTVGVGLWTHDLRPALCLAFFLGALLWIALIIDRIGTRRRTRRDP
jgi:hypothetical protein